MGSPGTRRRHSRWGRRGIVRLGAAMASGTLAVGTLAVLTTAPTALASDDERNWAARSGFSRTDDRSFRNEPRHAGVNDTPRVYAYWVDARDPRARVARGTTVKVPFGAYAPEGVSRVTVVLETAGLDARKVTVSGVATTCAQARTKITCNFTVSRAGWQTAEVTLRAPREASTGWAGWVALTAGADGRTGWLPTFGRVDVVAAPPSGFALLARVRPSRPRSTRRAGPRSGRQRAPPGRRR
ncbi:hypothetical protein ACFQX7_16865 [Luedemannella flava]